MTDFEFSYWRSRSQLEVDFLINDEIAIEVKRTSRVNQTDLKGLKALGEEVKLKRKIVVCMETEERKKGDIEIIPVRQFLRPLWQDEFI